MARILPLGLPAWCKQNKDDRTISMGDERETINANFHAIVQSIQFRETLDGKTAMYGCQWARLMLEAALENTFALFATIALWV